MREAKEVIFSLRYICRALVGSSVENLCSAGLVISILPSTY